MDTYCILLLLLYFFYYDLVFGIYWKNYICIFQYVLYTVGAQKGLFIS